MAAPQRGARGQAPVLRRTLQSDATKGVPRLRAWPRKKSEADKAKTAPQREWFFQAQWLTKFIPATQQAVALECTAGTPLMPRDILTMAMSGRLFSFIDQFGEEHYPVAARTDVQQALDLLSNRLGAVLFRSPSGWQGVNPPPGGLAALFCDDEGNAQFRQIATFQGSYKTRLHLTTNYAVSGNITIDWQAENFDEANLWDPGTPSILTMPADGILNCYWQYAVTGGGNGITVFGVRDPATSLFAGLTRQPTFAYGQVGTGNFRVTAGQQFEAYLGCPFGSNLDSTRMWLSAEFIPS